MDKRVLILLSGGVDSITLGTFAKPRLLAALFVDYGQPAASQEGAASAWWCKSHGVPWRSVHLPLMGADVLSGDSVGRVVPGRNLALISVGINVALGIGASEVFIGINGEDTEHYPDCRTGFLESVAELGRMYGVEVRAPLMGMSKAEVLALAGKYGVDVAKAWSCYSPIDGKPCGVCLPCTQRNR